MSGDARLSHPPRSAPPNRTLILAPVLTLGVAAVLITVLMRAGTWPGITRPAATLPMLAVAGLLTIAWLLARARRGAPLRLPRTALDRALPLWLAAFTLSSLANREEAAYIAVGLWFAGAYIALWYVLSDALARRLIAPARLIDGLLIAAIPVIGSALLEYARLRPLRISGALENANILGAFLVFVIPLGVARLSDMMRGGGTRSAVLIRAGYGVALIAIVMSAAVALILTGSRGGILGTCCAFGFVAFRRAATAPGKIAVVIGGILLAFALYGVRGDSGRSGIYRYTLHLISTEFVTGQGLFTFRRVDPGAMRPLRLPPDGQNLHAHNLGLQITVELGALGAAALLLTFWDFVAALRRGRTPASPRGLRGRREWAWAAAFGLLIQQIGDFTVMTPAIAVCFVIVLAVAADRALPDDSGAGNGRGWGRRAGFALIVVLIGALLAVAAIVRAVPRPLL